MLSGHFRAMASRVSTQKSIDKPDIESYALVQNPAFHTGDYASSCDNGAETIGAEGGVMKRAVIILGILLTFLIMPITALAQDYLNFFAFKAGAYFPTGDLDDANFDTGFSGEVSYGRYLHPNFATEFGVGYLQSEDSNQEVWAIPLTVTAKGAYSLEGVEVFGGAGVGLYIAEAQVGNQEDDETVWGGHLVAGTNIDLNPTLFVGVEGKYIFTDEAEFFGGKTDLNGLTLTANFGIRF
jgi:hypothetical protein